MSVDYIRILIIEIRCEILNWIEMRFQVLTAASMKLLAVFWVVAPCGL
jgi:hypothetical protein